MSTQEQSEGAFTKNVQEMHLYGIPGGSEATETKSCAKNSITVPDLPPVPVSLHSTVPVFLRNEEAIVFLFATTTI
jgi:hypothetical protein